MDRRARAETIVRATLSLGDAELRARYVMTIARSWSSEALAQGLDALCERAQQAEPAAREVLVAVVDALNDPAMKAVVERLREQAASECLLALERLVRPSRAHRSGGPLPVGARAPAREAPRANGRVLTLGERKWLARRPDRGMVQSLLLNPHPEVVRRCLSHPRMTEDDVLRLAARRPGQSEVLIEVARSVWVRRPRVRIALVFNPATPLEVATRIAGLLLRPELELVIRSPAVAPALRAVCLEHIDRRPPAGRKTPPGRVQ